MIENGYLFIAQPPLFGVRKGKKYQYLKDQPALDRHGPRRVHRCAEWREDAHSPIADLVAEPFDDDGAIVGDHTRGFGLLGEG